MEVFTRSLDDNRDEMTIWPHSVSNMGNSLHFGRIPKTQKNLSFEDTSSRRKFLRLDSTGENKNENHWDTREHSMFNSGRRTHHPTSTASTVMGSIHSIVQQLCTNTVRFQPYAKTHRNRVASNFPLQGLGLSDFCQDFLNNLNLGHCNSGHLQTESETPTTMVSMQDRYLASHTEVKEPDFKNVFGVATGDASPDQVGRAEDQGTNIVTQQMTHVVNTVHDCNLVQFTMPKQNSAKYSDSLYQIKRQTEAAVDTSQMETISCENPVSATCYKTCNKLADNANCDSCHSNTDSPQFGVPDFRLEHEACPVQESPNVCVEQVDKLCDDDSVEIETCYINTYQGDINGDADVTWTQQLVLDDADENKGDSEQPSDEKDLADSYKQVITDTVADDNIQDSFNLADNTVCESLDVIRENNLSGDLEKDETISDGVSKQGTQSVSTLSFESTNTELTASDSTQLLLDQVVQRLSFTSLASCSIDSDVNFLDDSFQDDGNESSCMDDSNSGLKNNVLFVIGSCEEDSDSDWSEDSDFDELDDDALRANDALWKSFTSCNDAYHPIGGWQCSNTKSPLIKSSSSPDIRSGKTSPLHTTPQNECVETDSETNTMNGVDNIGYDSGKTLIERTLSIVQSAPDLQATTENTPSVGRKTPKKKVHFPDNERLVQAHTMVAWQYAYKACRKGPWEEYARDRCRFERRIDDVAMVISPCLTPDHRNQIYHNLQKSV
ncbi:uncharacterized protein LOC144448231 [Glandiceps talaboti]